MELNFRDPRVEGVSFSVLRDYRGLRYVTDSGKGRRETEWRLVKRGTSKVGSITTRQKDFTFKVLPFLGGSEVWNSRRGWYGPCTVWESVGNVLVLYLS